MLDYQYVDLDLSCPSKYTKEEYFVKKRRIYSSYGNGYGQVKEIRAGVTLFEFNLLKLLVYQQLLSPRQLHIIYNYYYPIKYSVLEAKLNRWSKTGLLQCKEDNERILFTPSFKIYMVSDYGMQLMIKEEYLDDEWQERDLPSSLTRSKIKQYVGEQELLINLFKVLHAKDVKILSYSRFFDSLKSSKQKLGWKLKSYYNDTEVNYLIEFVTTNSIGVKLKGRIEEYAALADSNRDKVFVLYIGVMDKDYKFKNYPDLKTSSITPKQKLRNAKKYFMNKSLPENLKVVVELSSTLPDVLNLIDKNSL